MRSDFFCSSRVEGCSPIEEALPSGVGINSGGILVALVVSTVTPTLLFMLFSRTFPIWGLTMGPLDAGRTCVDAVE